MHFVRHFPNQRPFNLSIQSFTSDTSNTELSSLNKKRYFVSISMQFLLSTTVLPVALFSTDYVSCFTVNKFRLKKIPCQQAFQFRQD